MSSEDLFADLVPGASSTGPSPSSSAVTAETVNLSEVEGASGSEKVENDSVVETDGTITDFSGSISIPSDFQLDSDLDITLEDSEVERETDDEEKEDTDVMEEEEEECTEDQAEGQQQNREMAPLIQRRKRGGFKRGSLYRKKQHRSQTESCSGSGNQSEDYTDALDSVLPGNPSAESDSVDAYSANETIPSEGDGRETAEDEEEEKQPDTKASSLEIKDTKKKTRRHKTMLTKKSKYHWKKSDTGVAEHQGDGDGNMGVERNDIGISVHPQDVYRAVLIEAAPSVENLSTVASYLKLTLDDSWTVSQSDDTLFLCKMINPQNPVVERAITWKNNQVNFLVYNQQLPRRNILWQSKRPGGENCGQVADFLTSVSNRFIYFEVCAGVGSHEHLWEFFLEKGHIEKHSHPSCFRSSNCSLLLVYPGKCSSCINLQKKIFDHDRQKVRTASRGPVDHSKINDKYLQKEEIGRKIQKIQQEKKLEKQTVKRLRKRVDQLLQKRSENIDSELSNDFVEVMNDNTNKMTQTEKIFWDQQSKALSKRNGKSKTMRWHPAMIRLALHLRMLSPAAFDFMSGVISLPSQRRLFDYSQFTEIQEGVQEDLLEQLNKLIEETCPAEYEKYFSLILDEMSIRSDLVYNNKTGELIGFTNLTSLETELVSLEADIQGRSFEKVLAKKVLVFMLNGCCNSINFIAAVYSTDNLSAAQLFTRSWDVIYAVEEAGAKVLLVLFDGASVNRKFIRMHFDMGDKNFTYVTTNSASGEQRLLYFMLDPPHLIKTFRNCLANSFSHRKSRTLFNNDQKLSWKAIEALFELCQKYKTTKLTKAHVYLTSFSCMKVYLAAQVFSNAVADALEKFKHVSPLKEEFSEELVILLRLLNRSFDCLNGGLSSIKKKDNTDLLEYTSISDPRFDFLEKDFLGYLEKWEKYVATRNGNYSKEQRSKMIISYQSLEGMKITIHSFIKVARFLLEIGAPSVSSRQLNSDPLEQYFSDLRRARGSDNNPTLKQVLHTRISLHAQRGMTSKGTRGNTEVLKRQMDVDETPVPVRKKPKKE